VGQAERLEAVLQQNRPALLLLDLRGKEGHDLLMQVKAQHPDVLIIGFGTFALRTIAATRNTAGIYAAEDVNLERRLFQALIGRALRSSACPRGQPRPAQCARRARRSRPAPMSSDRHRRPTLEPCRSRLFHPFSSAVKILT
jgi:DNA-binding NtrC family response regulator